MQKFKEVNNKNILTAEFTPEDNLLDKIKVIFRNPNKISLGELVVQIKKGTECVCTLTVGHSTVKEETPIVINVKDKILFDTGSKYQLKIWSNVLPGKGIYTPIVDNQPLFKIEFAHYTESKSIDIIVPTFNNEDFTVKCFESLRKHTNMDYRIIWVDNGSTDESRKKVLDEIIKHKDYLNIWLKDNTGFVKASNIGLNKTKSDYVVLLNNDTEVTPGWCSIMYNILKENPDAAAIGPLTMKCHSPQSYENVNSYYRLNLNFPKIANLKHKKIADILHTSFENKYFDVCQVTFFCTMFNNRLFKEIGYLPDVYGPGLGDDNETCFNFKKKGKKILFTPEAFCFHNHRTTFNLVYSDDEFRTLQAENTRILRSRCKGI